MNEEKSIIERLTEKKDEKGWSWNELSIRLGIRRTTIRDWRIKGNMPNEEHQIVVNAFLEKQEEQVQIPPIELPSAPDRSRQSVEKVELFTKKEFVKGHISNLSNLFWWFLFRANTEEREELREEIGEDKWTWFLDLARAMTSETAFNVMEKEGCFNEERRPKI